jgi:hypothetical protein
MGRPPRPLAGQRGAKGEVKHQEQSNAAFDAVGRLPVVGGITNEIKVITAGVLD